MTWAYIQEKQVQKYKQMKAVEICGAELVGKRQKYLVGKVGAKPSWVELPLLQRDLRGGRETHNGLDP